MRSHIATLFLAMAVTCCAFAGAADPGIRFDQFYAGTGANVTFSPAAQALAGKRVRVEGYAAPPYRAEAGFFVLTRTRTHICPYCNAEPDWPMDVVVVYPRGGVAGPGGTSMVTVAGTLEIGSKPDAESGLASRLRLTDAVIEPAPR
jgi:hypothetical protein